MIGNPGAGKSTLLTSLVRGKFRFPAGISIATGLTKDLLEYEHEGTTYIDTPGLSDLKLREHAASCIERALRKGGDFRVCLK